MSSFLKLDALKECFVLVSPVHIVIGFEKEAERIYA